MKRLDGKVCIITGSNSGVGAATAELFAAEGAKVVITARRVDKLEEVANKIKANGGEVLAVRCDVSNEEDVKNMVKAAVDTFGTVDVLVNNAGILESQLISVLSRISKRFTQSMLRAQCFVLEKLQR